jgi:hypothetical protein
MLGKISIRESAGSTVFLEANFAFRVRIYWNFFMIGTGTSIGFLNCKSNLLNEFKFEMNEYGII